MFNSATFLNPSDGTSKKFSVPIVQELASQNLQSLPERFIKPEKERPNASPPTQMDIPIIDMSMLLGDSDLCKKKELEKLDTACREWGFFQAVNHGIPVSLRERMKAIVREFIQLPLEEKLKSRIQEIEGYGQHFVASDDQILDWSDAIGLTILPPENRKMNVWPTKPADFRETVHQYGVEVQKFGSTILRLLSERAALKSDSFVNMCREMVQMRMNYYPPCPRPDLVFGLSPHSDSDGLAVLLQNDETVGLHICKDGQWVPVQPIPDALVINIGDMLEVISNGMYKSIEHRVVTTMDRERISIAMFLNPHNETEMGPVPELIDELHPPQYKRFIRADYLKNFISAKLEGKSKIEFAKIKS